MRKENILAIIILLVSSMLFLRPAINSTISESTSMATVRIEPQPINQQIGDTFEINITVKDVVNLMGFSIMLHYQTSFLTYIRADADRSIFTKGHAPSSQDYNFTCDPDRSIVTLELIPSLQTHWDRQSGDGTLVTIKFYCNGVGDDLFAFEPGIGSGMRGWMLINSDLDEISCPSGACGCTVTHVIRTVTLNHPQNYTLPEDCWNFSDSPVFSVEANDVVLDLNGHTINHTAGGGHAIQVKNGNNVIIKNGNITNFQYGIEVTNCNQVDIFDIKNLNIAKIGVHVKGSSYVRMFSCNVSSNISMEEVDVEDSNHINISNCIVSSSTNEGLYLSNCSLSEISHNTLSNNTFYGIYMEDSVGNTISCNRISNNTSAGIKIRDSSQNKIFNNDFINNKPNHVDVYGSTNVWDSGYPQGGNYWDDWNDKARQPRIVDDKSGENQTLQGCDGIGDTQYSIKGDTQDRYPLLNQFNTSRLRIFDTPLTVKKLAPERTEKTSLIVAIFGDFAEIRNYTFNATNMADLKMIFDIDGGNFCNVIVPREILDGPFTVSIDNVTKEFMLCQDSTNTVAELNHGTRSHVEITVKLRGDMNGDGKVDITDLAMLARLYGLQIIP